ncbi:MAG: FAD-dependent oxidoreductase [Acidimicrobiales bacterium]
MAVLGGGMAGLATAWRLSEPGWRDRFESISVYQRGWRLGGKGASSRAVNGRVEEHGLHIWLGYYENAFRLLRECYAEIDRPTTDPDAAVQTWRDALFPTAVLGLADRRGEDWRHWVGQFSPNDRVPGDPDATGHELTVVEFVRRAWRLILDFVESQPAEPAGWSLVSVMAAVVRGIIDDNLLFDPGGFRAINDEDFVEWIIRHGASPAVAEFAFVRGLYDLVFGYVDADEARPRFAAGLAVFLTGKMLFDYKGAVFWKMAAGMGDVVFAPLYQALRQRGVDFEFFHRVDQLHVSADGLAIDAITVGRQATLAPGVERYEPLVRVKGLPCFPAAPLTGQLADADGIESQPLESAWCSWPDAEARRPQQGVDFDVAVLAIPVGMAPIVCRELIEDRPEWREMVAHTATVATQAFQIWLRDDEPSLGWQHPGSTVSGYPAPWSTWASMPQLIEVEDWPDRDRPGTIAYFCHTLDAPWPCDPGEQHERVRARAVGFLSDGVRQLLPGFGWDRLCGANGAEGEAAFDTQYWRANVDPSDRYVQSLPGTDRYRLRPDESGYDNLFLAGDWTDCGLNAGCIEAAVLSGLQAANAVLGRARMHRIAGYWLP